MKPVRTSRTIAAPLSLVFETLSNPKNFQTAVPHIKKIEFLTEQESGAGTRFRETREMNGREESVVLEVTEYVANERVRIVSDAGGTIWDSVFSVSETAGGVEMNLQMDVRPYKVLARVMNLFIRGFVVKGLETDMDAVKKYCESRSGA
jgi:hypothetical protein